MGASKQLLTSKEFADRSGLPVSRVTQFLRDGRIKGQKKAGKWVIPASELDAAGAPDAPLAETPPPKTPASQAAPVDRSGQTFSVPEFSAMTYLTEHGVRDWLKRGILKGARAEDGEGRIEAASLEIPHIKRLVR